MKLNIYGGSEGLTYYPYALDAYCKCECEYISSLLLYSHQVFPHETLFVYSPDELAHLIGLVSLVHVDDAGLHGGVVQLGDAPLAPLFRQSAIFSRKCLLTLFIVCCSGKC